VGTAFVNANKMKYIITESQYKRLTEENDEDFETFLNKKYPNIGNLKMVRFNTAAQGIGRKYVNPKNNDTVFRVITKLNPNWEEGKGEVSSNPGTPLSVRQNMYNYFRKYGMNFEYYLMDWFNKTYNENVSSVVRGR
jgi:hypothetical protein